MSTQQHCHQLTHHKVITLTNNVFLLVGSNVYFYKPRNSVHGTGGRQRSGHVLESRRLQTGTANQNSALQVSSQTGNKLVRCPWDRRVEQQTVWVWTSSVIWLSNWWIGKEPLYCWNCRLATFFWGSSQVFSFIFAGMPSGVTWSIKLLSSVQFQFFPSAT